MLETSPDITTSRASRTIWFFYWKKGFSPGTRFIKGSGLVTRVPDSGAAFDSRGRDTTSWTSFDFRTQLGMENSDRTRRPASPAFSRRMIKGGPARRDLTLYTPAPWQGRSNGTGRRTGPQRAAQRISGRVRTRRFGPPPPLSQTGDIARTGRRRRSDAASSKNGLQYLGEAPYPVDERPGTLKCEGLSGRGVEGQSRGEVIGKTDFGVPSVCTLNKVGTHSPADEVNRPGCGGGNEIR